MDKLIRNLSIGMGVMILLVGGILFRMPTSGDNAILPLGSVSQNDQYEYTQYTTIVSSSTAIKAYRLTLGSVIVTENAAVGVVIWDATSTAAVTDGNLATRVAELEDGLTEGVYTFDVGLTYGMVMIPFGPVDWTVFDGDWTITTRRGW